MKIRYNKVMEKIEVTIEMRDRILNNINNLDLDKTSNRVVPFRNYKKYFSIVACFVILLTGSHILNKTINLTNGTPTDQALPDIVAYNSAEELSKAIGFTVKEIQNVPFEVVTVRYTEYWKELGEIQYAGQDNTVVLRMAAGDEDVSGDYTDYTSIKSFMINDDNVTFKGNDGKYMLAAWQTGGYSYSMQFAKAISEQEMLTTVKSLK